MPLNTDLKNLDSIQSWWNEQLNDPHDYVSSYTIMQGYALEFHSWVFNLADKTLQNLPNTKSTQSLQGGLIIFMNLNEIFSLIIFIISFGVTPLGNKALIRLSDN